MPKHSGRSRVNRSRSASSVSASVTMPSSPVSTAYQRPAASSRRTSKRIGSVAPAGAADLAVLVGVDEGTDALVREHLGEEPVVDVPVDDVDARDAGLSRGLDGRHDAVDVDRHHHEPVHLLRDVGLDRVVLRRRIVVGVEDDQLRPELRCLLFRTLVHLGEEQCLLVDLDQGDGGLGRHGRGAQQQRAGQGQARPEQDATTGHQRSPIISRPPAGAGRSSELHAAATRRR